LNLRSTPWNWRNAVQIEFYVGIALFFSINSVMIPPAISIPSENRATSSKTKEVIISFQSALRMT
jgi:hypothetical protein